MKTNKLFFMSLLTITTFLLVGCKKEESTKNEIVNNVCNYSVEVRNGMLCFRSAEDFLETRQMIMSMDEAERRDWERQQGFKSYATKCYELLEELESQGRTDDDVCDFFKQYPEFFSIEAEGEDKVVRIILGKSSYFYFVNENRMMGLGKECLKAFETGVLVAPMNMVEELKTVGAFDDGSHSSHIKAIPLQSLSLLDNQLFLNNSKTDTIIVLENTSSHKSLRATRKSWSSGNRNTIELVANRVYIPATENSPAYYCSDFFLYDYPEHRVAGLWYPAKRRINYDVYVNWTVNGTQYNNVHLQTVDELAYFSRGELGIYHYSMPTYSFDLFKGTAYTYDTPAMNNFNSSLPNFGL